MFLFFLHSEVWYVVSSELVRPSAGQGCGLSVAIWPWVASILKGISWSKIAAGEGAFEFVFQTAGKASVKTLRQEQAWHTQGKSRNSADKVTWERSKAEEQKAEGIRAPCILRAGTLPFTVSEIGSKGITYLLFSCSVVSDSLWLQRPQHIGFPVIHCLPEFAQTQVYWDDDAMQSSHPLLTLLILLLRTPRTYLTYIWTEPFWPPYWKQTEKARA